MLKFYYSAAANPIKVALFLEEAGVPYEAVPIDTRKGDQHQPGFLTLNPNGKVPVIIDDGVTVFDSNAILLYLGEKTGQFMPEDTPTARGALLSWLMFVASGVGPYSGQAVHFQRYAPEPLPYAIDRYRFEAERHFGIIDRHLADRPYMLGEAYTIVDMSLLGWARALSVVLDDDALTKLANLKQLIDEISNRPNAIKAAALKDLHAFKTEMDEEPQRAMFPGNFPATG